MEDVSAGSAWQTTRFLIGMPALVTDARAIFIAPNKSSEQQGE
jgi:hypothetical protein